MTGLPYPVRLGRPRYPCPQDPGRGREVAGRVEATGGQSPRCTVGDEVFGIVDGSFAEYASARPGKLAPKPANLTFAAGRGRPRLGADRPAGVRDRGRVQAGQKVLVIGASGGVGSLRRA